MQYVEHPLIKPKTIEARIYQQIIFDSAIRGNTLVILPTGLGKTQVSVMLAAHRLLEFPESRVLMIAPTRPLTLQHKETFQQKMTLSPNDFRVLTGKIRPKKRKKEWKEGRVIFVTPQTVERDIISGIVSLGDFSLLVFDECHRAVGDYPYGFIAKNYVDSSENLLILGLTASPGDKLSRINEVKKNLFINQVEVRSEEDPDVAPYVQPVKLERRMLELPEPLVQIKNFLEAQFKDHLKTLKKCEFLDSIQKVGKRDLLNTQKKIRGRMQELSPNPPREIFMALMSQAAAFRLSHTIELLETQGLNSLHDYLVRLKGKARKSGSPKAVKLLVEDPRMQKVFRLVESCKGQLDNPKIEEAKGIVRDQLSKDSDSRIMVFAHYRNSASQVVGSLKDLEGVRPARFVGQANRGKDKGLSQKEQARIIDEFRSGKINVLVSTAVGEEGLDIPNVDLALFYEAVPSEIRSIQRRGRTGRKRPGRVVVLIMKGTRDEAFYWSAIHKERRMRESLREVSINDEEDEDQRKIGDFWEEESEKIKIIADHREAPSGLIRELSKLNCDVEIQQLDVGDFILSERVGVERKTVEDFLSSLVDKRLLTQTKDLAETFERPILVLEGEGLYSKRAIHPNAIRGALACIAVDYCIPVLTTRDEKETAKLLVSIARREQEGVEREVPVRGERKALTLTEQQRFVVEGLPGISAVLAKRLLKHFGSVEKVMRASNEELQEVPGVGTEKAKGIRHVLSGEFVPED